MNNSLMSLNEVIYSFVGSLFLYFLLLDSFEGFFGIVSVLQVKDSMLKYEFLV